MTYRPALHRLAIATAILALLPITVGAIVTTMKWGMAFLDYPTSDGHNMFLYPWLKSASDKFTEHGHRLAGMLVGVVSIGMLFVWVGDARGLLNRFDGWLPRSVSRVLALFDWFEEPRTAVKVVATLIPFCVLLQGLLGGARVLADDERMAMFHGAFAAVVFTLMAGVALVTSRDWIEYSPAPSAGETARRLRPLAFALPFVIFGQYLLGGALRHLGMMLHEHIGMAIVAAIFTLIVSGQALRSGERMLKRSGVVLLIALVGQLGLGIGSYVTKFGLATVGFVAVQHSLAQVILRTSHTVVGMLLLMAAVLHACRVARVPRAATQEYRARAIDLSGQASPLGMLAKGGAR